MLSSSDYAPSSKCIWHNLGKIPYILEIPIGFGARDWGFFNRQHAQLSMQLTHILFIGSALSAVVLSTRRGWVPLDMHSLECASSPHEKKQSHSHSVNLFLPDQSLLSVSCTCHLLFKSSGRSERYFKQLVCDSECQQPKHACRNRFPLAHSQNWSDTLETTQLPFDSTTVIYSPILNCPAPTAPASR